MGGMETTLLIDGGQSGCRARYEPGGATAHVRGLAGEIGAVAAAVPARRVIATNDAVTSHLGALGGEAGVVIVAGTGVIALAAGEDGTWARSDGHGSLLARLSPESAARDGLAYFLTTRELRNGHWVLK